MTIFAKVAYSYDEGLSYEYNDQEYDFNRDQLLIKGYRFHRNKDLKFKCWHDSCGYNIGHDRCKLPHIELTTDEKAYQDRTNASKKIAKDQMSNKTVGIIATSLTALTCACIALIVRQYDPDNIKNVQQRENIVHLSHGDQKAIDDLIRIFNSRMIDITRHTKAVQETKYKCLHMIGKIDREKYGR